MSSPRALAALTRPIARQAGVKAAASVLGRLALDWALIVGPHWAAMTRPQKLSTARGGQGAVLTLVVDPTEALSLQHDLARLAERINSHFGHRAVAQVKLRQRPIRSSAPRGRPAPLSSAETAHIETVVATVGDDALRQRLAKMGRTLYALDRTTSTDQ